MEVRKGRIAGREGKRKKEKEKEESRRRGEGRRGERNGKKVLLGPPLFNSNSALVHMHCLGFGLPLCAQKGNELNYSTTSTSVAISRMKY